MKFPQKGDKYFLYGGGPFVRSRKNSFSLSPPAFSLVIFLEHHFTTMFFSFFCPYKFIIES